MKKPIQLNSRLTVQVAAEAGAGYWRVNRFLHIAAGKKPSIIRQFLVRAVLGWIWEKP